MIKKIYIPEGVTISFYFLNNKKYLVVSNKICTNYTCIPSNIMCSKSGNFFLVNLVPTDLINDYTLNNYFLFLVKWFKSFEKPYRQKLVLKGLGLKAFLNLETKTLELKLGFSHISYITIPKDSIFIHLNKNIITIEGYNSVEVGNFVSKIRNLKVPNAYKEKGIWYKNEIKLLKVIKKT